MNNIIECDININPSNNSENIFELFKLKLKNLFLFK